MHIALNLPDPTFLAGLVLARGVSVAPSPQPLSDQIDQLITSRAHSDADAESHFPPPHVKDAVRDLLRRGGFKPAGRNKPASEYLAQAARERRFPRINNLVDCNNLLSLETGLPISLLDLAAFGDPPSVELRYGKPGESYVFNPAGQAIDLAGLVSVCRLDPATHTSTPLGNPIKDSMAGKLKDHTTSVLGVIYASTTATDLPALTRVTHDFADLLTRHCSAQSTETQVLRVSA